MVRSLPRPITTRAQRSQLFQGKGQAHMFTFVPIHGRELKMPLIDKQYLPSTAGA